MNFQVKNKLRALFLITVFSLSTVAGFACSIGIDLGYNSNHHEELKPACHSEGGTHHSIQQDSFDKNSRGEIFSNRPGAKDCCTNEVTDFIKMEKSVAQGQAELQSPVFVQAFASVFIFPADSPALTMAPRGFQFLRRGSPLHDTDIRIVIQSFQI